MEKKILMIGPLPPPIHGQAVCFEAAVSAAESVIIIDLNTRTEFFFNKLLKAIQYLLQVPINVVFNRPDLVYFTCSRTRLGALRDCYLLLICRAAGLQVINHLHGADFRKFYDSCSRFQQAVLRWSYSGVAAHIVLNRQMKKEFSMLPNADVRVVKNFSCYAGRLPQTKGGIDVTTQPELVLTYMSNLMSSKGIFLLLSAYEEVRKSNPNLILKVAGRFMSDVEMSAAEVEKQFTIRLRELEGIEYLGVVSGREKEVLLSQSDVFILPSWYRSEAVPLALIEAMSFSCGIITTRHNYLPELIGPESGLLVDPRGLSQLVKALEYYIKNPVKLAAHKIANFEYAAQNYSRSKYISNLKNIFDEFT